MKIAKKEENQKFKSHVTHLHMIRLNYLDVFSHLELPVRLSKRFQ